MNSERTLSVTKIDSGDPVSCAPEALGRKAHGILYIFGHHYRTDHTRCWNNENPFGGSSTKLPHRRGEEQMIEFLAKMNTVLFFTDQRCLFAIVKPSSTENVLAREICWSHKTPVVQYMILEHP